ncbi:hypothetical protein [Bacteriovorax sp. Seq25_V]|uniref:hypothetical protein n=1 Tax=Bacteriovorax sp. Seq25_V TaxID=1201288 RepID=UPI00038A17A2|nr:hypothetical protein [Bacteriovorax sp. Seq25_V]EQC46573.1 hypothetical protein M900_2372 [Bacteriovorax sp. Seq25_V]
MKRIVILLLLVLNVYAAKSLEGEGKFIAHDNDSLEFIKKQLLSDAFKKVIDNELKAMGLDYVTFWQNYEQKFNEHFKEIEETVEQKYTAPEGQSLSRQELEKKSEELRDKRLTSKAKFGRLSRVIKSYSITKMSKSVRVPNSHYINITAQVDRKDLTDIYYRFIGVSKFRDLKKVYLDISYNLIDTNWLELGVETETDFTNVVADHWKKNLEGQLSSVVTNGIEIADDSLKATVKERLKKSRLVLLAEKSSGISSSDDLEDSLYITIEVNIRKTNLDAELGKISLNFQGGFVITDLKDNGVIAHYDFTPEKSVFDTTEQHKLNSSIASTVYRLPSLKFSQIRKIVEESVKNNQIIEIVLKNTNTINEAISFAQKLKEKGLLLYMNTDIAEAVGKDVKIEVTFSGARAKAIEILGKMVSEKLSDTRIVTKDNMLPFVFNIVSLDGGNGSEVKAENSSNGN